MPRQNAKRSTSVQYIIHGMFIQQGTSGRGGNIWLQYKLVTVVFYINSIQNSWQIQATSPIQ